MDLFLLDAILKGKIPENGSVLDVGCGQGRNGIYFIKEQYDYLGIDKDASKILLANYLAKTISSSSEFKTATIKGITISKKYDLVIASRVLHFAQNLEDFMFIWKKINDVLKKKGVLYFSMDSAVVSNLVIPKNDELFEFADGRVSFALTDSLYNKMIKGFSEIERLRTIIHQNERVQSFGLLRKN